MEHNNDTVTRVDSVSIDVDQHEDPQAYGAPEEVSRDIERRQLLGNSSPRSDHVASAAANGFHPSSSSSESNVEYSSSSARVSVRDRAKGLKLFPNGPPPLGLMGGRGRPPPPRNGNHTTSESGSSELDHAQLSRPTLNRKRKRRKKFKKPAVTSDSIADDNFDHLTKDDIKVPKPPAERRRKSLSVEEDSHPHNKRANVDPFDENLFTSFREQTTKPKGKLPSDQHFSWRMVTFAMWVSLLIGVVGNSINGTGYAFPAWSDQLKMHFEYTQTGTLLVGSLGNVGQYLGPLNGTIMDVFGTRITCIFAATCMFIGNVLMYLTTVGITPALGHPAGLMGVIYMVAQIGAQCLYMATLTTNVKAFPQKYRAFVIGIQTAFFGLSATFFTLVYNGPFDSTDLAGYQFFVTLLQPCVALACAMLLIPIDGHKEKRHSIAQLHAAMSSEDLKQKLLPDNESDVLSKVEITKEGDDAAPTKKRDDEETAVARVMRAIANLVTSSAFWALWLAFFLGSGVALLHNNNYSQLTRSLNDDESAPHAVTNLVLVFSLCNFSGRLLSGTIDYIPMRRGYFYTFALLLMSVAALLAALLFEEGSENFLRIYIITAAIGFSYGMMIVVAPTIVSELWGTKNFAQNWGWVLVAPAAATYAFNGFAGQTYDREAVLHPGDNVDETTCVGTSCFRNSYFFAAGMSFLGVLLSLYIIPKTRAPRRSRTDPL